MTALRNFSFYTIGAVLVMVLSFLTYTDWHFPITFLCSGDVFVRDFEYIYHGEACDSFNVGVNKMFLVFFLLLFILFPSLGFWRYTARSFAGFHRVVYLSLGTALSIFPLAAALVATIMVTRLTLDMGITQKRIIGITLGIICIAVVPVCLYFLCRKSKAGGRDKDILPGN